MTMTKKRATVEGKRKPARNVDEAMDEFFKKHRRAMDELAKK